MTGDAPYLLIDAGNSRVKWALADAAGALVRSGFFAHAPEPADDGGPQGLRAQRLRGADAPAADAASEANPANSANLANATNAPADWAALPTPRGAWISNVAGEAAVNRIQDWLDARWPGLPRTFVRARAQQCGIVNSYASPERLGSDRWAGLIGAHAAFPAEPLLIATLGTATTLEALTAEGHFVGGMIAPGWSLMMRSLGEHTAQLPTLEADAAAGDALARHWFATDTSHAITAGSLLAQAGLIERGWRELCRAWGKEVRLVLGGGAAGPVAAALSVPHTRHDMLVLSGLALIALDDNTEPG